MHILPCVSPFKCLLPGRVFNEPPLAEICGILAPVSNMQKISARQIFTGDKWILNACLVVQDGQISSIEPFTGSPAYELLVPSFIDLQIYGASDRLFSVYPTTDSLSLLHAHCLQGGTSLFLPTVATNTRTVVSAAIKAVRAYWQQGGKGCLGLHLEGPWLHPDRKGAHVASLLRVPDSEELADLLEEGEGVIKLITLAPEICNVELIEELVDRGIRVSAGHSNATYEEATQAFNNGVSLATHLYNAMSPLQHRAPGMVGAIFSSDTVMASIIPDGYHVDWAAVQIAKKQLESRLFVITDAVTQATEGPYLHQRVHDRYETAGTLSGSSLTMLRAFNNLIQYCKIDPAEALRMCSLYPATAIGLDKTVGKLLPGYAAHWMALNKQEGLYTLTELPDDTRTFA